MTNKIQNHSQTSKNKQTNNDKKKCLHSLFFLNVDNYENNQFAIKQNSCYVCS